MFITDRVLDIILKAKDESFKFSVTAQEWAFTLAIAAKDHEIEVFKTANEKLIEELKYEKARADALVDRLLVRDAKTFAVSPQAVEAGKLKDSVSVEKLKTIDKLFNELNDVGSDFPSESTTDPRSFSIAGGSAVSSR